MSREQKKVAGELPDVISDTLTKKQAAQLIAEGARHIHSSPLGRRDPCFQLTREVLCGDVPEKHYPWQLINDSTQAYLRSSHGRRETINHVIASTGARNKRHMAETLSGVLEELLTNAIYHPYVTREDSPKYVRQENVTLARKEMICITYGKNSSGIFLSVADQGGDLRFDDISRCFRRCYEASSEQIEKKEGGAGLGLFFVYESVTHLRIDIECGLKTTISCWISDKRSFDPGVFSFNYFGRR